MLRSVIKRIQQSPQYHYNRLFSTISTAPIPPSPIVDHTWLNQHLNNTKVKVIDGSWYMPADKRNTYQEYVAKRIKGAKYFDLDGICDKETSLPHMLPKPTVFNEYCNANNINDNDTIVVYDSKGLFSSPRVWFTFKHFGAKNGKTNRNTSCTITHFVPVNKLTKLSYQILILIQISPY
jgi:hypothetical protein